MESVLILVRAHWDHPTHNDEFHRSQRSTLKNNVAKWAVWALKVTKESQKASMLTVRLLFGLARFN
jgi:hypothetical protein